MIHSLVVEVWEGNSIFCSDRLANDDFVDVVKLIPVLVTNAERAIKKNCAARI